MARTAIALFTRDLRVRDNPMLAAAAAADHVLPLFVHDDAISDLGFASPPRARFLAGALADLDAELRRAGAGLVVRRGRLVEQVCRLAEVTNAAEVHLSADVSGYAQQRQARLARELAAQGRTLRCHDEVITVVGPGRITPTGADKDHFAVFTPYLRRWLATPRRPITAAPRRLVLPALPAGGEQSTEPSIGPSTGPTTGPGIWSGGETEGRRRSRRWLAAQVGGYHERHDDLSGDATSRLSPYLHFGCLSPLGLATRAAGKTGPGAEAFVRQLAWRDFFHQVLAARPTAASEDYRSRGGRWRDDEQALRAWQEGRTGIPIVDAGMRQLLAENWMHNRARLITGSFLTKTLRLDWREGARHFFDHLVDGDVANNCLNWQWLAGTGNDTRPNRVLNPVRQAARYDPDGDYVRRWVPELADLEAPAIHRPWRLDAGDPRRRGYPAPILDLDTARPRLS
ncbi:MAG TPA: deoxyribodipyrimidine photo-lyase [Mycobacteriales bacterium]|jgi:deoxyribodipyrimidine photo-lyase